VYKISDLLILAFLMIFFVVVPTIIRLVKTKKFDTKSSLHTLVSGLIFAYSLFYGFKALLFVFSEEFEQYALPLGYGGYMVLGLLTFISVTFLSYYEMGFKDLFKHKKKKVGL